MAIDDTTQLDTQRADLLTVYRALAEFGRKRQEAKRRLTQSPAPLEVQVQFGSQLTRPVEHDDDGDC